MLAGVKTDCKLVDAELDRRLSGGAPGIPPQAQKHLDECERCRTLYSHLFEALPLALFRRTWNAGSYTRFRAPSSLFRVFARRR